MFNLQNNANYFENKYDKEEHNYYLFFDTETSGLPKDYKQPASNLINWPRLVQLAWLLYDSQGHELSRRNYIIKPENFIISAGATRIHGITQKEAIEKGADLEDVLYEFFFPLKKNI